MAKIALPHPLDPDWKWKEFAEREASLRGPDRSGDGRHKTLGDIVRMPLALIGCEIRRIGAGEFFVKLGPMRMRLQRIK
jgi:hypothetical protein